MLARLHRDHLRYFGKDAPWWWCLIARTAGPMPTFWDSRQWPRRETEKGSDAESC